MMAIIETGSKQYIVEPNTVLKIEKLDQAEGDTVVFDKVLLLVDDNDGSVRVGTPYIEGAKVTASLDKQGYADKIMVMKYKPKVRYRRKNGHWQPLTTVTVKTIA